MLGAIDLERGAKVSGSRFYFLTGVGAQLELALVNMAMDQAREAGFTQVDRPVAGQAAGDGGHRLPRPGGRRRLPDRGRGPLPRRHLGGRHGGLPLRRDPRRRLVAPALRRVQPVLPQGGRLARQGHPRHHPGALVRQGRDVRLHDDRGVVRRAPAAARVGEGVPRQARARLPRDRHRGRRPRAVAPSASSTARRGSPPRAATASSPRPPTAPTSRPGGSTSAAALGDGATTPVATLNGTLCAIPRTIVAILETHQQADGSVRVPEGAAALPRRARGAGARRDRQ